MKRSGDLRILAVMFVVLFVGGLLLVGQHPRKESLVSTTYNPDRNGVKAFYTLLAHRLGYNVDRLRLPYTSLPEDARVLIVVQPERVGAHGGGSPTPVRIGDDETAALMEWVKKGGVAIFASDDLAGVPGAFGWTRRIEKGAAYAFSTRHKITNRGMRDPDNAMELLRIINAHAGKDDLILFDEYHHGLTDSDSLWSVMSRESKVAGGFALVAVLLGVYSAGRRFGAVRKLPAADAVRPGYEFVESVGRLYQRAGATDLAADVFRGLFRQEICMRLGLPPDAARQQIVGRLRSDGCGEPAERVDRVLAACERSGAGHRPSEQELLDIAREIQQLEKELGLGGIRG